MISKSFVALMLSLLIAGSFGLEEFAKQIPNGKMSLGHPDNDEVQNTPMARQVGALTDTTDLWSQICKLDADEDGFTNGEELGDPCCTGKAVTTETTDPNDANSKPNREDLQKCDGSEAPAEDASSPEMDESPPTPEKNCRRRKK